MKCPKCNSGTEIMVDVTLVIPSEYEHKLSKRAIRDKRTEIWSANWTKAMFFCVDEKCDWMSKDV